MNMLEEVNALLRAVLDGLKRGDPVMWAALIAAFLLSVLR